MATCSLAFQVLMFSFVKYICVCLCAWASKFHFQCTIWLCWYNATSCTSTLVKYLYLMLEILKPAIILESNGNSLYRQLLSKMHQYLSIVLCGVQMGILWVCTFPSECQAFFLHVPFCMSYCFPSCRCCIYQAFDSLVCLFWIKWSTPSFRGGMPIMCKIVEEG